MVNWVLAQQMMLSVCIILVLIAEKKWLPQLGAKTLYRLWLMLPLTLVANNFPQDLLQVSNTVIYQYVVNFNAQSAEVAALYSWQLSWLVGVAALVFLALYSQWKFYRLPRVAYDKNQLHIEFPKSLRVFESPAFSSPVICGIFKPVLILPLGFQHTFSPTQQQLILQHELVHYYRADNLYNLFAVLLVIVFWFNPLSWLAYRAFRRAQELACDTAVLSDKNKSEKIAYSKALLLCAQQLVPPLSLYSQYGAKNTMLKRIEFIKNQTVNKKSTTALTILCSVALLTGVAMANQQGLATPTAKVDEATPVFRVEPQYPIAAARDNIEGSVILQFDIDQDGATANIKIIKAQPQQVFDKVSIIALEQWKYKPRVVAGQAQVQNNILVQLDYLLGDGPDSIQPLIEGIKVQKESM